jgi:hypothetical protein
MTETLYYHVVHDPHAHYTPGELLALQAVWRLLEQRAADGLDLCLEEALYRIYQGHLYRVTPDGTMKLWRPRLGR